MLLLFAVLSNHAVLSICCPSHFPSRRRDFRIAQGVAEGESEEGVQLVRLRDALAREMHGVGFFELDEDKRGRIIKNA